MYVRACVGACVHVRACVPACLRVCVLRVCALCECACGRACVFMCVYCACAERRMLLNCIISFIIYYLFVCRNVQIYMLKWLKTAKLFFVWYNVLANVQSFLKMVLNFISRPLCGSCETTSQTGNSIGGPWSLTEARPRIF